MGAVKEQSANLYATKMAEQGFVTLSLDLSFWGESDGQPSNAVSPDIYAEDFSAAVDFLGTRSFVDRSELVSRILWQRSQHQRSQDRPTHESHCDSQHVWRQSPTVMRHRPLQLKQRKKIIADAAEQR